jgi:hypothetical protein
VAQKDREQGVVPHTFIDTEAAWTQSGWHGWKLHLITAVATVWIPLAALLTPANTADNEVAPALIQEVPPEMSFLLGDRHNNAPNVRQAWEIDERILMASHYGSYPNTGDGVEVRRVFHKLCSRTVEHFNEHFKGIFDGHGQVPTKGLLNTNVSRWAPCSFINLRPYIALRTSRRSASVSKPS